MPDLQSFALAGGTALALRYGHRSSIDLVRYPHRMVKEPDIEEDIRLLSIADLAAMKIQAILGRGVKKDFWDLHELLQHHPLQELIDWHTAKFPNQMLAISIPHAITYFADADGTDDPVCFRNLTWEKIKKGIAASVREHLA